MKGKCGPGIVGRAFAQRRGPDFAGAVRSWLGRTLPNHRWTGVSAGLGICRRVLPRSRAAGFSNLRLRAVILNFLVGAADRSFRNFFHARDAGAGLWLQGWGLGPGDLESSCVFFGPLTVFPHRRAVSPLGLVRGETRLRIIRFAGSAYNYYGILWVHLAISWNRIW